MSMTRRLQSFGVMLAAFCVWAVPAMAAPPANTRGTDDLGHGACR